MKWTLLVSHYYNYIIMNSIMKWTYLISQYYNYYYEQYNEMNISHITVL